MSNEFDRDDIVERSLKALHAEKVPHGPAPDVVARTLHALKTHAASGVAKREDQHERSNLFMRIHAMTFAQRIAAVVMMTIGALTLWFMFALFASFSSVSYAQVARQIKDAQSMTMTMTTSTPQFPQSIEVKLYALEPGMIRNEGPHGVVTVSRREGDKIQVLSLEPKSKTAQLVEAKLADAAGKKADFVAEFRALADKPGEPLGERQVGDVKAKGFKVVSEGQTISLWAHPRTALPLLVEIDVPSVGGKVVLSDIVFDPKLDEKLFSLEVPEGYKLNEQKMTVTLDLEANVVNLLWAYTKAMDGTFPEKLDDWAALGKALKGGKEKVDPVTLQALSGAGAITAVLSSRKPGEDYAYTGRDAKLGEQDKIVFWYRDKAKGTYRAVFADLTVKDVTAEQILKTR